MSSNNNLDFQTLFALGMKRFLPSLAVCEGKSLDIGATGFFRVPGAEVLGAPHWNYPHPHNAIPAHSESIATIHAYHFLEHLSGDDVATFMREVERVLVPGGVFNYAIPYYSSTLAIHDLEHRSLWCEDTFSQLFTNTIYQRAQGSNWRLSVHFQVIAGIVQRNLALIGQLVKDAPPKEDRPKWYYPA